MKTAALLILFAATSLASAQETRREVVHATANPADAKRPNSASVPDVSVIESHIDRIVILRFKFGTDLLAGLKSTIQKQGIRNAVILNGFGSVRNYQVHQVSNRNLPSKDLYVKNPTAPADIISMSGMVMNGRVHAHMTMANADKAFGGHLEPDTNVFTFAVITLGVLDDKLDLSRIDDSNDR
jgi:predicted DNA-binding protein with PD1-like motif